LRPLNKRSPRRGRHSPKIAHAIVHLYSRRRTGQPPLPVATRPEARNPNAKGKRARGGTLILIIAPRPDDRTHAAPQSNVRRISSGATEPQAGKFQKALAPPPQLIRAACAHETVRTGGSRKVQAPPAAASSSTSSSPSSSSSSPPWASLQALSSSTYFAFFVSYSSS